MPGTSDGERFTKAMRLPALTEPELEALHLCNGQIEERTSKKLSVMERVTHAVAWMWAKKRNK